MNYLKNKVKKLEEKIYGKKNGSIQDWALKEARWELIAFNGIWGEEPKPNTVTEEEIQNRARVISQEFASPEEYEKYKVSQINWEPIDKALSQL